MSKLYIYGIWISHFYWFLLLLYPVTVDNQDFTVTHLFTIPCLLWQKQELRITVHLVAWKFQSIVCPCCTPFSIFFLLNQYWFIEDGIDSNWAVFGTVACCNFATHTGSNVHTTTDIWYMAQPRHGRGWFVASSLHPLCTIHIQFSDKAWSPRRSIGYSSHPHIWFTVSRSEKENLCLIGFWERIKQLSD